MANEKRVRLNFVGGLVDTVDLAATDTTLNSAGLAAITTTIDTTNHLPIILDPDGLYGAPEIAYVTALTVGASSATILRGQEGTTARQHLKGTPWVHGPLVSDLNEQTCLIHRAAAWNVSNGTGSVYTVPFDTVDYDSTGVMWSAGSPNQITIPSNGTYYIHGQWGFQSAGNNYVNTSIYINGASIAAKGIPAYSDNNWPNYDVARVLRRNAGDVVTLRYENRTTFTGAAFSGSFLEVVRIA